MDYSPFARIALCLCCAPALAAGQRARATRDEPAFLAPRYLHELESSTRNFGARATGDLDGDGDLDLVTLEYAPTGIPPGVRSWRNGGRADFEAGPLLDFEPWDGDLYSLTRIAEKVFLADVTGDGVLDLAYERGNPNEAISGQGVLVHPGLGDGGFGAGVLAAASAVQWQFAVGDCDADGDADVLLQESSGGTARIAWRRFENGSFVSGPSLVLGGGELMAADIDGDGLTDALMRWDTIRVYRTVSGAPTFYTEVPLPSEIPTGSRVHAGDLDGDGDTDLVAMHRRTGTPDVLLILPLRNDGTGFTAQPLQTIPDPGPLLNLNEDGVLADWDADGDLDYVTHGFTWLENDGVAQFTHAAYKPWQSTSSLSRSTLEVVDLNGDGRLDALAAKVCYFGDGTFPSERSSLTTGTGAYAYPSWDLLEDWEGDGDLDLVSSSHLFLNNGDGTGESRFTPSPPHNSELEMGWGDFDGDGFRDLVVADLLYHFKGMHLFRGTEDGSYVLSPTEPSPNLMTGGQAGDLDGDGDLDIIGRDGFWQNDGTGQFGAAEVAAYAGLPLLARDVDGDLDLDLLVARGNRLKLLTNLGELSFSVADLGPYVAVASLLPAFLDADQDGDADLVVAHPTNGVVRVHEQLPGGGFAPSFDLVTPGVSSRVGQIDVDADGSLDLVTSATSTDYVRHLVVWFRGEALDFPRRRDWVTDVHPLAFGDLDGDGDVEPIGGSVYENFRFDGPEDGFAVQYGLDLATPGTGGRHPILGSAGPTRPGRDLELVIRGGLGGASGVLWRGAARASVFAGGIHNLVLAPTIVRSFALDGPPGAAGAGSIVLRTPITSALVGLTFDYQAVLVDPGASAGLSATNGLEIRYGDWPKSR